MKNFAIVGVAGYVAPRHLKAIKDTGNRLCSAYDKSDSVGVLDSYFSDAFFFTERESFDRHNTRLRGSENEIDYITVCTPNYLHESHIRYGLRFGADVICEKPIVLNPKNIDLISKSELRTGHRVNVILQLRLSESVKRLKRMVEEGPKDKVYDIDLTYITSRGNWYYASWKGDDSKSGGLATNIGIHFYDVLIWIFGNVKNHRLHLKTYDRIAGLIFLEKANVRYFLSINKDHLPRDFRENGVRTYKSVKIEGEEYDLSEGFTELHTESYRQILAGNGFGTDDAYPSIQLTYDIGHSTPIGLVGDYHPYAKYPPAENPFEWINNVRK